MQFKDDCRFINHFAQQSAKNLAHVQRSVILTIQMDTNYLDKLNEDIKNHGADIPVIRNMESKREAVKQFDERKDYFFNGMHKILKSKKKTIPVDIIELFMQCKGLGLAKSAFLGQLSTGHKSLVCIDSVNATTYGFDPKILSISKKLKSRQLKRQKIKQYIDEVESIAKIKGIRNPAEFFWNEWCDIVAQKSKRFKSGYDVSNKHRHWFTTWTGRWELSHYN